MKNNISNLENKTSDLQKKQSVRIRERIDLLIQKVIGQEIYDFLLIYLNPEVKNSWNFQTACFSDLSENFRKQLNEYSDLLSEINTFYYDIGTACYDLDTDVEESRKAFLDSVQQHITLKIPQAYHVKQKVKHHFKETKQEDKLPAAEKFFREMLEEKLDIRFYLSKITNHISNQQTRGGFLEMLKKSQIPAIDAFLNWLTNFELPFKFSEQEHLKIYKEVNRIPPPNPLAVIRFIYKNFILHSLERLTHFSKTNPLLLQWFNLEFCLESEKQQFSEAQLNLISNLIFSINQHTTAFPTLLTEISKLPGLNFSECQRFAFKFSTTFSIAFANIENIKSPKRKAEEMKSDSNSNASSSSSQNSTPTTNGVKKPKTAKGSLTRASSRVNFSWSTPNM